MALVRQHPRALQSCERVQAVLAGRLPDRVPFYDSYWPQFRTRYLAERGLPPDTDLAIRFDHDYQRMEPLAGPWPSKAGELGWDSSGKVVKRDDYGLVMADLPGPTAVPFHLDCAIKGPRDLDRLPFEDATDEVRSAQIMRDLPNVCPHRCPVLKLGGPFSRTWRLRGIRQFLEDLAHDEAFAREMVGRMTDHLIAVGRAVVERTDFPRIQFHIADDFASCHAPLFSPATYERVFLPNLKKEVAAFHALGFSVSYESEGNIWPMLDLLDESGVDALANMEPRAGMQIERIRERFGDRFVVIGNVCNVQVLPSGDRARIAADVRRVLSAAVKGGYMGLSAHSIGTDISPATYDYFWGLMDRFARYPIDLDALAEVAEAQQHGAGDPLDTP